MLVPPLSTAAAGLFRRLGKTPQPAVAGTVQRNYVPLVWHDMAGELATVLDDRGADHIKCMDRCIVVVDASEFLSDHVPEYGLGPFASIKTAAQWLKHLSGEGIQTAIAVTKTDRILDSLTQVQQETILRMAEDLTVRKLKDHAPARDLLQDLLRGLFPPSPAAGARRRPPPAHPAQKLSLALKNLTPRVFFVWTDGLDAREGEPPVTYGLAKLLGWCLNERISRIISEG
jgi:hypothetical protein